MISLHFVFSDILPEYLKKPFSQLLHLHIIFPYMKSLMLHQITLIGMFLPCVYSLVIYLITFLCKTFVTMVTLKWPFFIMYSLMFYQRSIFRFFIKIFFPKAAFIYHFSTLNSLMTDAIPN